MDILIIEDEAAAHDHLVQLIQEVENSAQVIQHLDSVAKSVSWLQSNTCDLIFQDVHLSDGISFSIFERVEVDTPVIFTTAHDQYAIEAFKVNSIDYLLKPVSKEALALSLEKYNRLEIKKANATSFQGISKQLGYQKRFLVTAGAQIKSINTEDIAYFYGKDKLAFLITHDGGRYVIDHTLQQLESMLAPDDFFRVNRQYIISISAIQSMFTFSRSRVKVELAPPTKESVIVSGDRSSAFKKWLNH